MGDPLTLDHLQAFFQTVGTRVPTGSTLYLLGGCALYFLGQRRPTFDLDYLGTDLPSQEDEIAQVIRTIADEMHIEAEGVPLAEFLPLPVGSDERHHFIGQFGNLALYAFDPYSIALSKIDRGFDSDLDDVRFLIKAGYVTWERLEQFIMELFPLASAYHIDPLTFQEHWDDLRHLLAEERGSEAQ